MITQEDKDALLYKLLENGLLKGPISRRSTGRIKSKEFSIGNGPIIETKFIEFHALNEDDEPIIFTINSGKFQVKF